MTTTKIRSPSLYSNIRGLAEILLQDVHTAHPGRVVGINLDGMTAKIESVDVQPELRARTVGGSDPMPVVARVPILFPRAGEFFISLPIAVDDKVLLIFAERSIDEWLEKGTEALPDSTRRHALTDAFCIPASTFAEDAVTHQQNLVIGKEGGSQIHITPAGQIRLGSETAVQPVPLGFKLLQWASTAIINTPMGPAFFSPAAIQSLKDTLSTEVFAK